MTHPAPLLDLTPADDPTVRHIRDCLPRVGIRERLAECQASCNATPEEAAQAAKDLAVALFREGIG